MEGINLSQAMRDHKNALGPRSFLDKGFIAVASVFFAVAAAWVGLILYLGSIDSKMMSIEQALSVGKERIAGKEAARVGDFSDRSYLIGQALRDSTDPREVFDRLERMTVQGVVLTKYGYDSQSGVVVIEGSTDNFKYIAQQILSMKLSGEFSGITVDSIGRTPDGAIGFSLAADLEAASVVPSGIPSRSIK